MTCLEPRLVHQIAQQLVERLYAEPKHVRRTCLVFLGYAIAREDRRCAGDCVRPTAKVMSGFAPRLGSLLFEALQLRKREFQFAQSGAGFALLQVGITRGTRADTVAAQAHEPRFTPES